MSDDPRVEFLSKQDTKRLYGLIGDTLFPDEPMSFGYFALGLSEPFRNTTRAELFDIITGILRERIK